MGAPAPLEDPRSAKAIDSITNGFILTMSQGYSGRVCADISIPFMRFFAKRYINDVMHVARACGLTCQIEQEGGTLLFCQFRVVVEGPIDSVLAYLVQLRKILEEGAA
jgi:hypothetical protein